jgi:hypothetical protein
MHYDEIVHLQTHHSAWNLLRSPHAPLVLSFLGRIFIEPNAGGQPAAALISQLDDELCAEHPARRRCFSAYRSGIPGRVGLAREGLAS